MACGRQGGGKKENNQYHREWQNMLKVITALQAMLIARESNEDGGYTLEALLVGTIGVALIITLFAPIQGVIGTIINSVEDLINNPPAVP